MSLSFYILRREKLILEGYCYRIKYHKEEFQWMFLQGKLLDKLRVDLHRQYFSGYNSETIHIDSLLMVSEVIIFGG